MQILPQRRDCPAAPAGDSSLFDDSKRLDAIENWVKERLRSFQTMTRSFRIQAMRPTRPSNASARVWKWRNCPTLPQLPCIPWQQVGEPDVWINGVELCRFDQGVGDGSGLAARLGADEEVVLPPEGDGAHAAFGCIVVQFEDALIEVGAHPRHPGQRVSDYSGERRFSRDRGELQGRPSLQIVKDSGDGTDSGQAWRLQTSCIIGGNQRSGY